MLESEARGKWCPFVRTLQQVTEYDMKTCQSIVRGACAVNRNGSAFYDHNCIGSRCMAWVVSPHDPLSGKCGMMTNDF